MRKVNTFLLAIITLMVLGCVVVGSLYLFTDTFKPGDKPSIEVPDVPSIPDVPNEEPEITNLQFIVKDPTYGTFCIEKLYNTANEWSSLKETSFVLKDKTNIGDLKQLIFGEYSSHQFMSGYSVDDFDLAVVPGLDFSNGEQPTLERVDFEHKEQITGVEIYFQRSSSPQTYRDKTIYTLKSDIFTYTKPYENIDVVNRQFTIGIYNKTLNRFLVYCDYNWIVQEGDEHCFLVSDKNYIFIETIIEKMFS